MERFSDTTAPPLERDMGGSPVPPELVELGESDWSGVRSAGLVLVEPDGRVWIREPRNHFGGYRYTWPKGWIEPGEHPQIAAHRETLEEMGLTGRIHALLGDYAGSSPALTRFYLARRLGGSPQMSRETSQVVLATSEEAASLLHTARDLAVLTAAGA